MGTAMRYIRKKSGIVIDLNSIDEIKEKEDRLLIYHAPKGEPSYWTKVYKKDIVKQSDNLEKLFDKIVHFYQFDGEQCSWEFASEHDLGLPDWKRQYAFHIKEHQLQVRGAIFTEWGMKYVAKLNVEGEWELL